MPGTMGEVEIASLSILGWPDLWLTTNHKLNSVTYVRQLDFQFPHHWQFHCAGLPNWREMLLIASATKEKGKEQE